MYMKSYDLAVIGGGPAGSMAALTAARLGLGVLLVERDPVIGTPVRCAEGVDDKGLREFFEPDPRWISATITGYNLVAPDGSTVAMNNEGQNGYILDRTMFDPMIAREAEKHGAEVLTSIEAVGMSGYDGGSRAVMLRGDGGERKVRAGVVVAADGVESRAARWAGLNTACSLHDMETCAQAVLEGIDIDSSAFSLFFTGQFAPGGYAWIFPKGHDSANVGLGISGTFAKEKSPVRYLEAFVRQYFPNTSVVSRTVGGVQCSGGIKKTIADGVMVCCDAAHMANPITGGGIINSMIAGQIAAETAEKALRNGGAIERSLREYEKRCEKRFGRMNRLCYRVKEGIVNIRDDRLNAIACEVLKIPVEKRTPVRVLKTALIHNPKLLAVLPRLVF